MEWEYIDNGRYDKDAGPSIGTFDAWIFGFCARAIYSVDKVISKYSAFGNGVLAAAIFVNGEQQMIVGDGLWADRVIIPAGRYDIPPFEVAQSGELRNIFTQLQGDIYSIASVDEKGPFEIVGLP